MSGEWGLGPLDYHLDYQEPDEQDPSRRKIPRPDWLTQGTPNEMAGMESHGTDSYDRTGRGPTGQGPFDYHDYLADVHAPTNLPSLSERPRVTVPQIGRPGSILGAVTGAVGGVQALRQHDWDTRYGAQLGAYEREMRMAQMQNQAQFQRQQAGYYRNLPRFGTPFRIIGPDNQEHMVSQNLATGETRVLGQAPPDPRMFQTDKQATLSPEQGAMSDDPQVRARAERALTLSHPHDTPNAFSVYPGTDGKTYVFNNRTGVSRPIDAAPPMQGGHRDDEGVAIRNAMNKSFVPDDPADPQGSKHFDENLFSRLMQEYRKQRGPVQSPKAGMGDVKAHERNAPGKAATKRAAASPGNRYVRTGTKADGTRVGQLADGTIEEIK